MLKHLGFGSKWIDLFRRKGKFNVLDEKRQVNSSAQLGNVRAGEKKRPASFFRVPCLALCVC